MITTDCSARDKLFTLVKKDPFYHISVSIFNMQCLVAEIHSEGSFKQVELVCGIIPLLLHTHGYHFPFQRPSILTCKGTAQKRRLQ